MTDVLGEARSAGGRVLGIGLDLVDVPDFRVLLERRGARLRSRLFSEAELNRADARRDPPRCLAAHFAVKEAAFKALGTGWTGEIRWTDVELVPDSGGKDGLAFGGEFSRRLREKGVSGANVSISTTRREACALVVLVG